MAIQLILDYRLKYVNKDRRTTAHLTNRRWLFWVSILIGVATSVTDIVNNHKSAASNRNLSTNFDSKISVVIENQSDLGEKLDKLALAAVAPNARLDSEFQSALKNARDELYRIHTNIVNLQMWKEDRLSRKMSEELKVHRAKELEEERKRIRLQPYWDGSRPVYQFAVQRLEEYLRALAHQYGETTWISFKGIPIEPTFGELGELGIGTNLNWHLTVSTDEGPSLWIRSKSGLSFNLSSNPAEVIVYIRDGDKGLTKEVGISSRFKETVEPALRDLILELAEQDPKIGN